MKRLALLLLLALITGCTSTTNWGVLNNTRYTLQVVQDGSRIAHLEPGETVRLGKKAWAPYSSVCVSAYSKNVYMGGNSYTFYYDRPYIWQIDNIDRPGDAR